MMLFEHKGNDTALNGAIKGSFVPWHLKGTFTKHFLLVFGWTKRTGITPISGCFYLN